MAPITCAICSNAKVPDSQLAEGELWESHCSKPTHNKAKDTIKIRSQICEGFASVSCVLNSRLNSAEVSAMPGMTPDFNEVWYINRVLVHWKRQGFGTLLLTRLISLCRNARPNLDIIVDPGGYNESVEDQRAFYVSCGFVEDLNYPGRYVYDKTRELV